MAVYQTDRQKAIQWSREQLANPRAVILDTESTGLDGYAEIVQIAVCDMLARPLLISRVKPTIAIPRQAQAIHGITDAMVESAPHFTEIAADLSTLLAGRDVIIYNAAYDHRLLIQSADARGLTLPLPVFGARYHCAMEMYAQWVGDYSTRHGSYTWQPLPAGDHSALGNCRACLQVLRVMANTMQ